MTEPSQSSAEEDYHAAEAAAAARHATAQTLAKGHAAATPSNDAAVANAYKGAATDDEIDRLERALAQAVALPPASRTQLRTQLGYLKSARDAHNRLPKD